jgi:hypothetical protein
VKSALLLLAILCVSLTGCASTSPQAEDYNRLSQPTGSVATSSPGTTAGAGVIGGAYDLAMTAVGAAAVPGYLDKPPASPMYVPDANPEPYPR